MVRDMPGQFSRKEALSAIAALSVAVVVAEVSYLLVEGVIPADDRVLRTITNAALDLGCVGPVAWWVLIRPLWRSQAALRSFFNDAPVGLYRSTLDGHVALVNRTLVQMLGYEATPALFLADIATAVYRTPEERARVLAQVKDLDTFDGVEAEWKRRDGTPITVLLSGRTMRDAGGQVTGFEGAVENVTEHRRTQKQLRLVETALHAAANAITITSREGAIEWVNAGFTNVTGYRLDEVIGMTPRVLKSGRTPVAYYEDLWATIAAGRPWHGAFVNRRKDGTFYDQDLTITPVRDKDGVLRHFIGVGRDVTEQRRLEAQLRQAQKMEAVGQFTGGIAHDFNNILAVILANADLIASGGPALDPGLKEDLADIKEAAGRGATMIRKLLGYSRLAELQLVPMDLGEAVQGVAALLRRVLPESVEMTMEIEPQLPAVRADVGAVEQIILNLATNARDAMPNGGRLTITVGRCSLDTEDLADHPWVAPGAYVCIAVTDSGHGMDADTQRRIFDPFFTTKPPGKGTGLGMPMIYGLTKQQGGFVHVYSEPGRGTTIRIYLPQDQAGVALALSASPAHSTRRGRGELILLVEDEESLRRTGRRILERLGYRVLLAADGVEGLEVYRAHQDEVALIISDMVMPRMGGRELHDAVCRLGTVKFILASGYAPAELRASGAFEGAVRHLPKPWTLTDVAEAVRDALDPPERRAS